MNNLEVIILCGGKGQRLRPITENIPKPMVEIKEKPILSYILDYLSIAELKIFILHLGISLKSCIATLTRTIKT